MSGSALRRSIGWLGHDLQLYPELTARENLSFFVRLSGTDNPATFVDRALEYLTVNRDAQSFIYLQVMDTHTPFDPPSPQRGKTQQKPLPLPYRSKFCGTWALRIGQPLMRESRLSLTTCIRAFSLWSQLPLTPAMVWRNRY